MTSDLLTPQGRPNFGVFTGDIENLSLDRYQPRGMPGVLKRFRAKKWRFAGIYSPEVVGGVAVVNAGYMGSCFAYALHIPTGKIVEYRAQSPLAIGCSISDHALRGQAVFSRGGNLVMYSYGEPGDLGQILVDVTTSAGPLTMRLEMDESRKASCPHQITTPTPGGSFAFTHKTAGNDITGRMETPFGEFTFKPGEAFGAIDHTAGYHDKNWEWRWSSFGGRSENGRRVGLNLVAPVHHETIMENAMWVDGDCYPLSEATFEYDTADVLKPWHITTKDGAVDMIFTPKGQREETINVGILMSRFHQPAGLYEGTFTLPNGEVLRFSGVGGVAEEHIARW